MLVTFHTNAWSSITMFGDVAVTLLKMAGHSGTVPSAMLAADIPAALERLEHKLAATGVEIKGIRAFGRISKTRTIRRPWGSGCEPIR